MVTARRAASRAYGYTELLRMRRPCVYAWRRGPQWLYVGTSARGIARFLGFHHVIGTKAPLRPGDRIVVWDIRSARAREQLEHALLTAHRPKYNSAVHGRLRHEERRCKNPNCNVPFVPRRTDQEYHTDRCRNQDWYLQHRRRSLVAVPALEEEGVPA